MACTDLFSGSDDEVVTQWDANTGKRKRYFTGHQGPVHAVLLLDSVLVSGGWDSSVRLWDTDSGQCVDMQQEHTDAVYCLEAEAECKVGALMTAT